MIDLWREIFPDRIPINKKAFTLIELVACLVILVIFAVIALPVVFSLTDKAESNVCETNKAQVTRLYAVYQVTHPETDFETFLATEYGDEVLCPNNGVYTLESGTVICSYHDAGGEDPDPAIIILPEDNQARITGTWAEVQSEAASGSAGITVNAGEVYIDESGEYYVITTTAWLGESSSDTELSEYTYATRLITDTLLTPDDVSTVGWVHWTTNFLLRTGMIRLHTDDNLYVYIGADIQSSSTWAEVDANWKLLQSP